MSKWDRWRTPEGLNLLGGWARAGLTDEQIAEKMGISRSTLNQWRKKFPDISDTLKKNKEIIDNEVENALLKKALAGDTTAMIFWLKNRCPEKWRDVRAREAPSTDGDGVEIINDAEAPGENIRHHHTEVPPAV